MGRFDDIIKNYIETDIDFNKNNIGVYSINDRYIGRSKNIKQRITTHIGNINSQSLKDSELYEYLKVEIKNKRKIKVSLLSDNLDDEDLIIFEKGMKLDLFNNCKIYNLCKRLKNSAES